MKILLKTLPFTILAVILICGCNTLNTVAVTLTQAEDAVIQQWATLHNDGKTTAELDLKVMAAHDTFNKAKLTAAAALKAYDTGAGDQTTYVRLLEAARAAIDPLFDLIQPLLAQDTAKVLRTQIAAAKTP